MKRFNIPIKWKITSLTLGVVLISIVIGMTVFLGLIMSNTHDETGERTMLTAQLVAQMETVQRMGTEGHNDGELQQLTERIRATQGDDYIILLDMAGKRLTHPVPERIGTIFEGGDESASFHEHVYLSEAQADGGRTIRAFVPVMNTEQEQVGVVVVGNQLPEWQTMLGDIVNPLLIFMGFALTFGVWGSWQLAKHIKSQTFEMEPDELARTLKERTATFHAIHEGVIAIDQFERITIMNDAARSMLKIQETAIGENIHTVIPDTRLPEVLRLKAPIMEREFYVQGRAIFSNRIPIKNDGETIGAVAIFQDKTEMTRLARQLTGVQNYVDALRVQNHEYSNKLHTIAGLIQLGKPDSALDYIFQVNEENARQFASLSKQVKNESIAGLLIGKVRRAKEMDIQLHLQEETGLDTFPEGIDEQDLGVMIGNLLTNSMEAFSSGSIEDRHIHFGMYQTDDTFIIEVSDNGAGIDEVSINQVFEKGFSTKENDGRGLGLHLVRSISERVNGEISVYSEVGIGTEIAISIPMFREMGENNGEQATS